MVRKRVLEMYCFSAGDYFLDNSIKKKFREKNKKNNYDKKKMEFKI